MQVAFLTYSISGGADGQDWAPAEYYRVKEYGEIKAPARKYIFAEGADPRGTNLGSWQMHPKTLRWNDPLAMYTPRAFYFVMVPPADEQTDIEYMANGFPVKSLK